MAKIAHVATVDLSVRYLLLPQLRALREAGHDVTAISAPGPWVPEIEAVGIRFLPWHNATRAWDPRADLRAYRELLGLLRTERFDVVHTHNPKPGVLGRIAARRAGLPVVLNTVHGMWATPEDRARRKVPVLAAEWLAARYSDLEFYQSGEDLAWARRLRVVGRKRSVHLGNGVDLTRFTPALAGEERIRKLRAEMGIGEDELVVGTVGRMVREKGYEELFQVARVVRDRVPNARFLVIGQSDPDKPDAITAAEIEAVRDAAVFTGWREDIPELMALMDVFVLPSWREGMPRSAIEAAASGLPLVMTDIRGCREVIDDGHEGLLVPVRDPAALTEAILRLLHDPAMRARMGAAARVRAEREFDERRVARTVVYGTERLVAARGAWGDAASQVRVRDARAGDARVMAALHRETMPSAFLPTLGDGFMTQLYRAMVADPSAVVLVAERGGRVIGFASAVTSTRAFFRRFALRRGVPALIAAAPRLARASVRRGVRETAGYPAADEGLPAAELTSIAVDAAARAAGVGRGLAEAVVRRLGLMGVDECRVVVGADNEGANRFYERVGFRHASRITVHAGQPSNVWVTTCRS